MASLCNSLSPVRCYHRFLDYRLNINDQDRKRFKEIEASLKTDPLERVNVLAELLNVDSEIGSDDFGKILHSRFKSEVTNMCRDSRLSSLAGKVELLGHQLFAENFELSHSSIDRFIHKGNARLQKSVLSAFPSEEKDAARAYLSTHPKFYSVAKSNYWPPVLQHIKPQELTTEKRPFYMEEGSLKIRVQGNDRSYRVNDWTEIEKELEGDLVGGSLKYRLVQRGLAKGKNNDYLNMEPFKEVDSNKRCVFQSITSLLRKAPFANPIGISMGNTGHVLSQLIIPQEKGKLSDVYSWGLFMKEFGDLGDAGPLATFSGSIKSPDDHWTRIVDPDPSKGYVAVVKEYEFSDDTPHQASLYSYATEGELEKLFESIKNRNTSDFERIVSILKDRSEQISKPVKLLSKEEKGKLTVSLVNDHLTKERDFHLLDGNCSVDNQWQEKFIISLLGATYHPGNPVKVYDHQILHSDVKISFSNRVSDFCLKILIAIGMKIPGSGNGTAHPNAPGTIIIAKGDRANTTFASVNYPTNVPGKSFFQRAKGAFWNFINYLRGRELPISY